MTRAPVLTEGSDDPALLPAGAFGVDAGITLTKVARGTTAGAVFDAYETATGGAPVDGGQGTTGLTGALVGAVPASGHSFQEIDAAVQGVIALTASERRQTASGDFLMALLGTGTAFAAVRGGVAQHLGGTPLGGGSFTGIARRVDRSLTYRDMIERATRGDRTRVDTMIADVYPLGIGRVGPAQTAAHLAKATEGSLDDFLAGLLNLHGENIAQIAAGRALMSQTSRIVLAGGFAHENVALVTSIVSMAAQFRMQVEVAPHPGFAGAVGAALLAVEATRTPSPDRD